MFFLLRLMIGILLTVGLILFVALNRADVAIFWNPLGDHVVILPIYILVIGGVFVGAVFGGLTAWLNMSRVRKERRKLKRDVKRLEKEVVRLQDDKFLSSSVAPATDIMPALSIKQAS